MQTCNCTCKHVDPFRTARVFFFLGKSIHENGVELLLLTESFLYSDFFDDSAEHCIVFVSCVIAYLCCGAHGEGFSPTKIRDCRHKTGSKVPPA